RPRHGAGGGRDAEPSRGHAPGRAARRLRARLHGRVGRFALERAVHGPRPGGREERARPHFGVLSRGRRPNHAPVGSGPGLAGPTPRLPGAMASYELRLDPWAAEYDGPMQLGEEPAGRVDLSVEGVAWEPIRPEPGPLPRRAAFVDGVRRVDQRLLVEDG